MEVVPTTPTKVGSQLSSIPSPKVESRSPRQYKRRNTTTPLPQWQRDSLTPLTLPSRDGRSHLTSFYKENIRELNQLQDIMFQKKALLDTLTDELNECRSKYEDVEFKWETLREEKMLKCQQINLKSNELTKLKEEQESKRKFMKDGHELHMQQLKAKNDADLNRTANEYRSKIEVLKFAKIKKFQNERDLLLNSVENARNKMAMNDEILKDMLQERNTEHCSTKEKWLQDYQERWRENTRINEETSDRIDALTQEITGILKPKAAKESAKLEQTMKKFKGLQDKLAEYEAETIALREEIARKSRETNDLKKCRNELEEYIESTKIELEQIHDIMIKEESMRRTLHNELQELRGNIRVFCRVRPLLPEENSSSSLINVHEFCDDAGNQTIEVKKNSGSSPPYIFRFDKVFTEEETNRDVFKEIGQLVQSSLDGYNVCIFAYGQTGSGKTYTMLNANDGIIPATINHIFSWTKDLKERGWRYDVSCQFIEIYNETIADLLRDENKLLIASSNEDTVTNLKHEIRHNTETRETTITNVTTCSLTSEEAVDGLLKRASKLRATASTASNERSSRSHSIFIVHLSGRNLVTGESSKGVLNLVDLAGSERINTSQVVGERLRETQSINRSLSCLGDVIHALGSSDASKRHIPFRNSKLTYLLQYSLAGNSKTLMFVNISGNPGHTNETLNSLRFASKVNSTKISPNTSHKVSVSMY
ncbi:hypothetical protein HG536_0C02180 [Torulaspora globosa]|uniref:Kinesin-like protein n=1 Tax=Torulaspora globosa TaxID=48254 RepID=A0A7G3ZEW3_9SACH|nr:uncharacterized protein HG536_0C02180 [Torulaspora globosa]QLL32049.1 hypothetical protein HG536_0C02180 [Torulaspora globosa]